MSTPSFPPVRAFASHPNGKRVLVVEDEPLLAAALEVALRNAGCQVVGPTGTLAAAVALAGESRFDAAILDVNLQGELSYPVAALLVARAIPFAFLTGYTREMLPPAFQAYPVIQKPVLAGAVPRICATLLVHGSPQQVTQDTNSSVKAQS